MSNELYCYDCNRAANTECVEQKHKTSREKGFEMATDKDQFTHMFEYHSAQADQYAGLSHEGWRHREIADGYSALSEAHNQFALICGRIAGIDLSEHEGEM